MGSRNGHFFEVIFKKEALVAKTYFLHSLVNCLAASNDHDHHVTLRYFPFITTSETIKAASLNHDFWIIKEPPIQRLRA